MYSLVEEDTLKSVLQNIRLILTTPKGADIHRPNFGSDLWQFIDAPLSIITLGRIKAEIVSAIEEWEPRAKVKDVKVEKDYISGRMKISLVIEIPEIDTEIEDTIWM